ncbi:hypothetical protein [Listeria newyorkensis]|uniref:Uncharacterized protein n=1 Tax=Listeria newyorkensis TaxID=1497681 RepID=A0A841YY59_9LIST|nr:hypothetical protein [Listeria newyorkensis]MBC1457882.1 hypothetical protein [Listeria newyorkensis]
MEEMNFDDFDFEVITVESMGSPSMMVNLNGTTFNRILLEIMGYPAYVAPLISKKRNAFAIQTCKAGGERAIKFSKPKNQQKGGVKLSSTVINDYLRSIMKDEWNEKNRYQVEAVYHPDKKAMVFDLNSATEFEPFRINSRD